jgi:exosortase
MLVWVLCLGEWTDMDYSYCLFVPLIFAYLIFIKREQIASLTIRGSNGAMGLIVTGLALYWFGLRSEIQYFGYLAVQMLLAGVILWFWGWAVFRKLLFPWAFFGFVWPLPFLEPIVAFPLRMVMSHLAGDSLNILGIPTIQNGTSLLSAPDPRAELQLGAKFQIDIADPCSGLRSLFALLMCSALYSHLFLNRLWQQWIVFLSAIPLAIMGNLVRILMLTIGSIWFGSSFAIGTTREPTWFHETAGFMVFGVALGLEMLLGTLLTMNRSRREKLPGSPPPSTRTSIRAT